MLKFEQRAFGRFDIEKLMDDQRQDVIPLLDHLLWLYNKLHSEKDGIERPTHFDLDKSKTLDQFARDVSRSATNMVPYISGSLWKTGLLLLVVNLKRRV